jgi:alpha-beta hydrolase superfamily lysophospholipase
MNHVSSYFPDRRGNRIHLQSWEGSTGGYERTCLLLHGLEGHSGAYPALLSAFLADNYRIVAPDFPGYGLSPGERGSGGVAALADAAETLLRRLEASGGKREIAIVAHSLGAVAALLLLKRYPWRALRVAVVSPLLFGLPEGFHPAFAADLDRVAAELLSDSSYLRGRVAAFLVGEEDPLVPRDRLEEAFRSLPLAAGSFAPLPGAAHEALGGAAGGVAIATILAWLDEGARAGVQR